MTHISVLCILGLTLNSLPCQVLSQQKQGTCSAYGTCSAPDSLTELQDVQDGDLQPGYHDLTYALTPTLPVWTSKHGLGESYKKLVSDMSKGDAFYSTQITFNVHTGTHMDSPAHFLADRFAAGDWVSKIPLTVLTGPALVVRVPSGTNITAKVVEQLNIPEDCERLLLQTTSTYRRLMEQTEFASDYVAFTADGAEYLAQHTNVQLVGIDYLSIATVDHLSEGHAHLFKKSIIPVEGLNLTTLQAGRWYHLTCLPVKLQGAEGAPANCVAYGPDVEHEQWRVASAEVDWAASLSGLPAVSVGDFAADLMRQGDDGVSHTRAGAEEGLDAGTLQQVYAGQRPDLLLDVGDFGAELIRHAQFGHHHHGCLRCLHDVVQEGQDDKQDKPSTSTA